MTIKEAIQAAMKEAMIKKESARLECLRMAKGALLMKEKEKAKDTVLSEAETIATLRGEVRKRQQSMATFEELGKTEEVEKLKIEIDTIESFLPQQLSAEDIEAKVRAYLAEHPEINHAGKLTGALKKELGDLADGKILAEACKRVLEESGA